MLIRYNFSNGGFFPADNGLWVKYADVERMLIVTVEKLSESSSTEISRIIAKVLEELGESKQ